MQMLTVGAVLLLLLLAQAAVTSAYYPTQRPSTGHGVGGRLCSPPYGYRPHACGRRDVISRITEPICEYLWGPNVCLVTDTVRSNVSEYRYHQGCDWVYSHYYYTWIKQCDYICQPSGVCLKETQLFNRSYEQCCPGFASRPPQPYTTYNPYSSFYHYSYYTPIVSDPEGCPVAVADSLLECLKLHGLDEFISYIEFSVYYGILNSTTNTHLTLFAPTNDVIRRAIEMGTILEPATVSMFTNISNMIGNHIVRGNITMDSLKQFGAKIYTNLEGRHLHRVVVSFGDYSVVTYAENSYYSVPTRATLEVIIPFINGAEVVIEDACNTVNGSLQIINKILSPAPIMSTIANYLQTNPERFSNFTAALDTVGLLTFLNNPNVSRTVFAVPNNAFASAFPPDLMACISAYMRRPFNDLLLYHIGMEAHYSSSLSLMNFFYTLLGQYLKVEVDAVTGRIALGRCGILINESDIVQASNGVIHVVEKVLFPDNFSFGMCEIFVPEISPTVCEVPTPPPSPTPRPTPIVSPVHPSSSSDLTHPTPTPTPTPVGEPGK